jgi:dimethylargininase
MRVAITREVSQGIARCELTHLAREPIDVDLARQQHRAYEARLREAGYSIVQIPAGEGMPDSVFVEDTALVFDELAIITRPGAESRRAETMAVAAALADYRLLRRVAAPGCLDGGDVLTVGRRVFIGTSLRTNAAAVAQVRAILEPFGYTVTAVAVHGCLHLKSAVTAVADDTLLINRDWVAAECFGGCELIEVDAGEPMAANALRLHDRVIYATAFPRTRARLEARGLRLAAVDVSEIAKAEGAVTCCSLIVDAGESVRSG